MRSGVNWIRLKSQPRTRPEGPDQEGLAQAGDALDQDVAVGQERREDAPDQVVLTDVDLVHLGQDLRLPGGDRPVIAAEGRGRGLGIGDRGRSGSTAGSGFRWSSMNSISSLWVMTGRLNGREGEPGPSGPRRGRDDAIDDTHRAGTGRSRPGPSWPARPPAPRGGRRGVRPRSGASGSGRPSLTAIGERQQEQEPQRVARDEVERRDLEEPEHRVRLHRPSVIGLAPSTNATCRGGRPIQSATRIVKGRRARFNSAALSRNDALARASTWLPLSNDQEITSGEPSPIRSTGSSSIGLERPHAWRRRRPWRRPPRPRGRRASCRSTGRPRLRVEGEPVGLLGRLLGLWAGACRPRTWRTPVSS